MCKRSKSLNINEIILQYESEKSKEILVNITKLNDLQTQNRTYC